jgi:hypothetical protein
VTAAADLLSETLTDLNGLKETISDALAAKSLKPETVDNVVELALLRSFSVGERFIREMFYLCMLRDPSVGGTGAVVPATNHEHVRLLLHSTAERDLSYVSWLPSSRFLGAADRYLHPGNPFDWLKYRQIEVVALNELVILRNAVAHPDSDAMEKFAKLAGQRGYPSDRVARFLLSTRAGDYEVLQYIVRLEQVARALTSPTEYDAAAFLEPEPPFSSANKAPAGEYVCSREGHPYSHPVVGNLPACQQCSMPEPCSTCGHRIKAASKWVRQL